MTWAPPLQKLLEETASPRMRELLSLLAGLAVTALPLLLTGATGSGKSFLAQALHASSGRRGRFVSVPCGSIPQNLMESELFGHVRGAYTNARGPRRGKLLEAHHGTLFLDEIGDLPLEAQAKLLVPLDHGIFCPLGSDREVASDFRLVAATNKDLDRGIQERWFREDLYQRLRVRALRVPSLRERPEDIPVLARKFVALASARAGCSVKEIAGEAMAALEQFPWPGNVRQLQFLLQHAVALCASPCLGPQDILPLLEPEPPVAPAAYATEPTGGAALSLRAMREAHEREDLARAWSEGGGSVPFVARQLAISVRHARRRLQRYGFLPPPRRRSGGKGGGTEAGGPGKA